jgi:hypothetical protein
MMKLFKKKKSDNKLATTMLMQQQQQPALVSSIKKPVPIVPINTTINDNRSYSPPTIVMPKPRRLLTPTRAILSTRFDHDKTEVEPEVLIQDIISPILLPTSSHHEGNLFIY